MASFEHQYRRGMSFFLVSALILACICLSGGRANAAAEHGDSAPAVLVNGTVITRGDFQRELDRARRHQEGAKAKLADDGEMARLKREALENLITRELLFQESRKRNIKVAAADVEREFKLLRDQFANQGQFALTMTRMRLSEPVLREQITHGLAIRALVNESIGSKISVSDDEIISYYERNGDSLGKPPKVNVSHILVSVDPAWNADRKQSAAERIAALRKRISKGEDFAILAVRHSDDSQSKAGGGDLGWFVPGQLVADMEKQVAALKVGEVSAVVEDRFGLHLIKVLERKPAVIPPLDEVRGKIRGLIKQEKGLKQLQPFVRKLRDGANVEIVMGGE